MYRFELAKDSEVSAKHTATCLGFFTMFVFIYQLIHLVEPTCTATILPYMTIHTTVATCNPDVTLELRDKR